MKVTRSALFPLLFAVAHPACKSTHETNAEPTSIASAPELAPASAPATPPGPTVSCLDLPRKGRLKMHVSEDQKTVYYVEVTHEMQASGERIPRYALVALDVATRTAKTLDDNVGTEVQVTKRGQIVFARSESGSTEYGDNRRLYVLDPNQAEPRMLSAKNGKDVRHVAIDENTASAIYVDDSKVYQVPLAGGPPKKLTDGWMLDAVLDSGVLVRQQYAKRNLVRFDGRKGKEFKIEDEDRFAGVNDGFMIALAEDPDRLVLHAMSVDANGPNTKKELALDRGARSLRWNDSGSVDRIIAKHDQNIRVYQVHGADMKKIFTSTGAALESYMELENGTKVVLACHDTHGNEVCDQLDETDVCFIERAAEGDVIDIPKRTVPTPLKEAAEKIVNVTTDGDLAGAKIRFLTRDDGGYQAVFESPQDGPMNADELRARARALQGRITELSGVPSLSIRVNFANGFTANTTWHDGTKRFYSFGGVGAAELADVKEYPIEIDTTIVAGWETSTCRGKLKNISDKPLEMLTVECSPELYFGPRKAPGRAKMSPPVLGPGVEGQFMTTSFDYSQYSAFDVKVVVKQGDQEILPYNRYAAKKGQERWDQAVSIYNASGLSYFSRLQKKEVGALVLASPAFQKLDKSEQEKACAKAIDEMVKLRLFDRAKSKKAVLKIHDPMTKTARWHYKDGQLSDVSE